MNDIILSTQNGEPVVSSRQIAESFGKEHKHVLDAVKNLVAENSAAKSMFYPTTFSNRGKTYLMYLMNRDGFSLLVMGFTGKAALEWKLKYIAAFNEMEKRLADQHIEQLEATNARLNAAIAANARFDELYAQEQRLISAGEQTTAAFRKLDAQIERDWQNYLDTQINQLQIAAVGLPAFDEIMENALAAALPGDGKQAEQARTTTAGRITEG